MSSPYQDYYEDQRSSPPEYTPPERVTPAARVYVGGVRVPVIDEGVTTQVRKDGPMAINHVSDITIPAVGPDGQDWAGWMEENEVGNNAGVYYTPVEVQFRSPARDSFVVAHRGIITGYGSGGGTANTVRIRVSDISTLMSEIFAGKLFKNTNTSEFASYITSRLEESQPVFDDLSATLDGDDSRITGEFSNITAQAVNAYVGVGEFLNDVFNPLNDKKTKGNIKSTKDFNASRDTLSDVTEWLSDKTGLYMWFEPNNTGSLTLIATEHPGRPFKTLGGGEGSDSLVPDDVDNNEISDKLTIDIIRNRALAEIEPFNQLEMRGKETGFVGDIVGGALSILDKPEPDVLKEFPRVVAEYPPLTERMGVSIPQAATSDATRLEPLKNETRRRFKRAIQKAGSGEIIARPAPQLLPYDRFDARPTCQDVIADVKPISFEVEAVSHHAEAVRGSDGKLPHTEIKASVAIDTDKIEFVEDKTGYVEP